MVKFLRRTWTRYAKLGKGVKKNQKWRRPTGRDNKMREKKRGKPAVVSIGYGKKDRKEIVVVKNLRQLDKLTTSSKQADASSTKELEKVIIIGNIGQRKKIELVKKAKEKGVRVSNVNVEKFLKKLNKKTDKKETKKPEVKEKKK